MSLLDLFDGVRYEKKLRKIKEEHFQRVADLEDKIHKQTLQHRELEVRHTHDVKELEQKYKLEVQEIVSRHEKELQTATHKLDIEKEKWDVQKEKLSTKHERDLNAKRLDVEKKVFEKLSELVEREGLAKETVVNAQAELLRTIREAIPNVNWDRQDGSPKLAIEHSGTPTQRVELDTNPKKPVRRPRAKSKSKY